MFGILINCKFIFANLLNVSFWFFIETHRKGFWILKGVLYLHITLFQSNATVSTVCLTLTNASILSKCQPNDCND